MSRKPTTLPAQLLGRRNALQSYQHTHKISHPWSRFPSGPRSLGKNSDPDGPAETAPRHCVIIECDGILMDVHNEGHRVAFNKAFEVSPSSSPRSARNRPCPLPPSPLPSPPLPLFQELGHTCVQWTPPVYFDLLRLGDSTGPGLIKTYYEMAGWPMMLPTSERPAFVDKVYALKQRIFTEMAATAAIPLRDGATQFIDDLLADGVLPVVLGGTASAPDDRVVSAAMMNLGPNRAFQVQVLTLGMTSEEREEQENGDGEEGSGNLTFEQQVASVQNQAKVVGARSFA